MIKSKDCTLKCDTSREPSLRGSPLLLDLVTRVAGKCFHRLYGSSPRLGETGVSYMNNGRKGGNYLGIEIVEPEGLDRDISLLKEKGKGIILINHPSSRFADYLPVFGLIGDEILQSTTFFTGSYNLAMNQREFPGYRFEAAPEGGIKERKALLYNLHKRLMEIERAGGYIFLMPAGPGVDTGDKPFQALFGHILRGDLSIDTPILSFHVEHSEPISRAKILLRRFGLSDYTTTIEGSLTEAGDWALRGGKAQRAYYNSLFHRSK